MARRGPSSAWMIGAAVAALLFWASKDAEAAQTAPDGAGGDYPPPPDNGGFVTGDGMGFDTPQGADLNSQLEAFLYMIRNSEHTRADALSGRCYTTFYKGAQFRDLSDHPVNTKELRGVPLTDAQCAGAGLKPGCVSTAAGAYQIIRPTWDRVRAAGLWGPRLPDFSPASQDEAARRLLIECGALRQLDAGNFSAAVRAASGLWASLPGSNAGQNPKSLDTVTAYFSAGGGVA